MTFSTLKISARRDGEESWVPLSQDDLDNLDFNLDLGWLYSQGVRELYLVDGYTYALSEESDEDTDRSGADD